MFRQHEKENKGKRTVPVTVAQYPCTWMATLSILGPNVGQIL